MIVLTVHEFAGLRESLANSKVPLPFGMSQIRHLLSGMLLALSLIPLTGPDEQVILLNPNVVGTIRQPRAHQDHFPPGTRCLINTSDGKIVVVQETCDHVRKLLEEHHEDRN
jgi:hypothetical protein